MSAEEQTMAISILTTLYQAFTANGDHDAAEKVKKKLLLLVEGL
jgi:hypothetical protein